MVLGLQRDCVTHGTEMAKHTGGEISGERYLRGHPEVDKQTCKAKVEQGSWLQMHGKVGYLQAR